MISANSGPALQPEERQTERRSARRDWGWIAVALWIVFIFFSSTSLASERAEAAFQLLSGELFDTSSAQQSSIDLLHLLVDKGFHVMMFCVLAILLWLVLHGISRRPWLIILGGAVVGSCSEFLQRFFPDRDPAIRDVIINICGTALGILFCWGISKSRRASQRQVR